MRYLILLLLLNSCAISLTPKKCDSDKYTTCYEYYWNKYGWSPKESIR
jgi:hypothetical protein